MFWACSLRQLTVSFTVCVRTQGLTGLFSFLWELAGKQVYLSKARKEGSIVGTQTPRQVTCFEVGGRPWKQACNPQAHKFLPFPLLRAWGFAFSLSLIFPMKIGCFSYSQSSDCKMNSVNSSFVLICAN